jgi:hypothetical protein
LTRRESDGNLLPADAAFSIGWQQITMKPFQLPMMLKASLANRRE